MTEKHRFDVSYRGDDVSIDYHFCREWDGDDGCYGTNTSHGMTFDEARAVVADHYARLSEYWRGLTYEKWAAPFTDGQRADGETTK